MWEESKEEAHEGLIPLLGAFRLPDEKVASDMMKLLYGVRCSVQGSYLGIWPPAFEAWNLLVFSMLDVSPLGLASRRNPSLQGIAMAGSATSTYGQTHAVAYAWRRGASPNVLTTSEEEKTTTRGCLPGKDDNEALALRLGRRIAAELDVHDDLEKKCSAMEQILLAIAYEGYATKVADAIGFDVEPEMDQRRPSRFMSFYRAARNTERCRFTHCIEDVPTQPGEYLKRNVGYEFPVLQEIHASRPRSAIAAAIRDTFTTTLSMSSSSSSSSGSSRSRSSHRMLPVSVKVMAFFIYARVVQDPALQYAVEEMASFFDVKLGIALRIADAKTIDVPRFTAKDKSCAMHYLLLARAIASTPVDLPSDLITALKGTAGCDPRAIVDLVHVVALAQLLHRLNIAFPSGCDVPRPRSQPIIPEDDDEE